MNFSLVFRTSLFSSALVGALALIGCGPAPSADGVPPLGIASASGFIKGQAFSSRYAVARPMTSLVTYQGSAVKRHTLELVISDQPLDCETAMWKNSHSISFTRVQSLGDGAGTSPVVDAATQTPRLGETEVDFNAVDGACRNPVSATAEKGSLVIDAYEIDVSDPNLSFVTGSFDTTFFDDRVTGKFNALLCPEGTPAQSDCQGK